MALIPRKTKILRCQITNLRSSYGFSLNSTELETQNNTILGTLSISVITIVTKRTRSGEIRIIGKTRLTGDFQRMSETQWIQQMSRTSTHNFGIDLKPSTTRSLFSGTFSTEESHHTKKNFTRKRKKSSNYNFREKKRNMKEK